MRHRYYGRSTSGALIGPRAAEGAARRLAERSSVRDRSNVCEAQHLHRVPCGEGRDVFRNDDERVGPGHAGRGARRLVRQRVGGEDAVSRERGADELLATDPVGMTGVRLEADFHVITAQTNAIANINKCIQRAGLQIDNLILEPLASSQAVLSDEEKEAGIVLVDIGGGTTDIAIFHDSIIRHTAVIPFGGNIITADIKQGCMVMQNQAEKLKTEFGRALAEEASTNDIVSIKGLRDRAPKEISVKNLAHIIQARMEEIIEMVHTEIICSGYEGKLAGGIVLTGGGALLQYSKQLFELMTGMDVRIGYPNEHLGKSKIELVKNSPMFSTTVGLVLSGFRALDDRENKYMEMGGATINLASDKPEKLKPRMEGGLFQFRKILDKTKGLLIDDIEDGKDY